MSDYSKEGSGIQKGLTPERLRSSIETRKDKLLFQTNQRGVWGKDRDKITKPTVKAMPK